MITVYQFQVYDIKNDELATSTRWGTDEAIKTIARGKVLYKTAAEVDESAVESDLPGFTERNFSPNKREGFQQKVSELRSY